MYGKSTTPYDQWNAYVQHVLVHCTRRSLHRHKKLCFSFNLRLYLDDNYEDVISITEYHRADTLLYARPYISLNTLNSRRPTYMRENCVNLNIVFLLLSIDDIDVLIMADDICC